MTSGQEIKFLRRVKKYPEQVILAQEDAVTEGFEYLESAEYLAKPDAVNRVMNLFKVLGGFGYRNFIKTAKVMGTNIGPMRTNMSKNFTPLKPHVDYLEKNGHLPEQNEKVLFSYPNKELWKELQQLAVDKLGLRMGFTEVPRELVFKGKAIPYKYALVFVEEMAPEAFREDAEMMDAGREVVKIYNLLGQATNQIAEWLRTEKNVHCMANHPMCGLTDYVPLAEKAGLGRIGHNGLLITPDFGTRHRISPIYVQEKIFEFTGTDAYNWIDDFCMQCRACEYNCPTGAIYPKPEKMEIKGSWDRGREECIDQEKCFQYFSRTLGCSQCIRVCPFVKEPFDKIKKGWDKAQQKLDAVLPAEINGNIDPDEIKRVAIIGAGPAGIFAAEEILKRTSLTVIDIIEKLPVPFGLVRYGVAPDHKEVKSKIEYFHDVIRDPRVEFYGNITVGRDLSVEELQQSYDAVIFSCGVSGGRKLGIPGENLKGSFSAPDFVSWYNGHPDFQNLEVPVKIKSAAVIGMGNVSLDVSRMLLKEQNQLQYTDISADSLDRIKEMNVREVHIIGRRGPSQAKFTPKELIELIELPGVDAVVDDNDMAGDVLSLLDMSSTEQIVTESGKENYRIFKDIAAGKYKQKTKSNKKIYFHFFSSPHKISGKDRVVALSLEKNQSLISDSKIDIKGTGVYNTVKTQLVMGSVGYQSEKITGIPLQDKNGIIENIDGRVCRSDKQILKGVYCSGWIRRGPSGIIRTNKNDALAVADAI